MLWADEGNRGAVAGEAGGEEGARQDAITGELGLLGKEGESRQLDAPVQIARAFIHFSPSATGGQASSAM